VKIVKIIYFRNNRDCKYIFPLHFGIHLSVRVPTVENHVLRSASKTIDSPSFREKIHLTVSRSSENCSVGTDSTFPAPIWMQIASLASTVRLVLDEQKITQRDTSLDNPSADKAFRRSREPVRARSAHFRRRVFHFRHYTDTPRRPRKQWPNGVLDIVRYLPPSLLCRSLRIERMNDRLSLILRSPCVLFAVLLEIEPPSARAFSAHGRGSELHFTRIAV